MFFAASYETPSKRDSYSSEDGCCCAQAGPFFRQTCLERRLAQHLGEFFHQIKVRQHIGRKVSIPAVCRRMRRLERLLY